MQHTDLLVAAEKLSAEFRGQADEIERQRRIPAEISEKMAKAGFYLQGAPAHAGGLEVPPTLSSQVIETLAQGDASCAWVAFIGSTSGTALSGVSQVVAKEILSKPDVLITGVFAPNGRAEKVADGFNVTGRWQWGSGSQNADWILGGCMLFENGEPMLNKAGHPRNHMVIMPASEVEYIDTWHVSGLCGSGSLDYQVTNLFVPHERVVGLSPRDAPKTPLYAFPNFALLALGIGAVCMGIARAAISELIQLSTHKKRIGARKTIGHKSTAQITLAEAEAKLRSARLFYYDALEKAWECAQIDLAVSMEQRRDLRLATTHAVMTCASVVDDMYNLAGGASVYRNSPLQRHFRDIHVATQHIMVAPSTLETIGSLLFGLDANVTNL